LIIEDSTELVLKSFKPEQLLPIGCDTLHGTLNYTLQKQDAKNKATVLRFDKNLKQLCFAEQIDVARVNSFTNFQQDRYIYQSTLYLIKTTFDTINGKQFFLSAYQLKDITKPFEYTMKWQFAFERKYIQSAHIFYADSQQVMLFVNVNDGAKKGQWLLRINAKNGFLIRGTKLNSKTEEASYQFSDFFLDKKTRDVLISGQRIDNTIKNAALTANKAEMFLVKFDSMGNIVSRSAQIIHFLLAKVGKSTLKTELKNYAIQTRWAGQEKNGDLNWWCHVYQVQHNFWQYMDSHPITVSALGEDYTFSTKQCLIQPAISGYFWSTDKLNTNGQLTADSVSGNDGLYYSKREQGFLKLVQSGGLGTKTSIVQKIDTKKQIRQLQQFVWDGKVLKQNLLKEEASKTNSARVIAFEKKLVLAFEEDNLILKLLPN
jgi:hypothetical protein